MRVPRRHRFRSELSSDDLFRRLPPVHRFRFTSGWGRTTTFGAEPVSAIAIEGPEDPFAAKWLRARLPRVPVGRDPGAFEGGAVGFVSYEHGHRNEGLPALPDPGGLPEVWLGIYDTFATHDPSTSEVEVVSWGLTPDGFDERVALLRAGALEERLREPGGGAPPAPASAGEITASLDRDAHGRAVEHLLDCIARGEIYQGDLTVRFDVPWSGDGVGLFERLARDNPAPFAAFVEGEGATVISSSPERLLSVRGRRLESRPIKGTAGRAVDPDEDRALGDALRASSKDRAELLMITDLLRNDLGKVSRYGTVRVPELWGLESFPHVHHLVSTVRGELRPGLDVLDALAAVFPGGSIAGAPKRRAMEILRDLEPRPRGVYTGTVGWIGFDRSAELNVAIRTGHLRNGIFSFGAGGGIVADSRPDAEWRELRMKAKAFRLALEAESRTPVREGRPA